jgi:quinol monooxygenase YgiN
VSHYHIRTIILEEKVDEFIRALRPLWFEFLKEDGCNKYRVYREFENDLCFLLVGEFKSREAMAHHLQGNNFEVLCGAASVLGDSAKVTLCQAAETGKSDLAKARSWQNSTIEKELAK